MTNSSDGRGDDRDLAVANALGKYLLGGIDAEASRSAAAIAMAIRNRPVETTWWALTASWGKAIVPMAVAASILLVLFIRNQTALPMAEATPGAASTGAMVVAVGAKEPSAGMASIMVGSTGSAWLIATAVRP